MTSRGFLLGFLLACVGCAPGPVPKAVVRPVAALGGAPGRPDVHAWFPAERASEIVVVDAGVAGDRVSALVDVPDSSCAVFIARGTDTIEDLDLVAYGEDGAVLGMDEGNDSTPALLVCPPHPARIFLAARIAAGHGLVAIGVERLPESDAERAAATYHARHRTGEADARLSAWPGLAERVAEHRRRLGGSWADLRRVALPLDARIATRLSATIAQGRCVHALVLGSAEVSHLELSALDENGHILGRATALGRDRSMVVCAVLESVVTFELRPQSGRGVAVLVLSQSDADSSAPDDALRIDRFPNGTLDDVRQRNAARLNGLGYAAAQVVKNGQLQPGHTDLTTLVLPKGCARLDVLLAEPIRDVSARLWGADDSLLAGDDDATSRVLFACSSGGPARLDVESLSRAGAYGIELRLEPETAPLLHGSPLAASRLLGYMTEHGLIASASQAGKVTRHDLTPEHLATEPFLVPLGRCVDVTLALGAHGTGAEVRLVDAESGAELAFGRGTSVASAHVCAVGPEAGGTIHARAEFRVRAGQSEGLSTMRLSTPAP